MRSRLALVGWVVVLTGCARLDVIEDGLDAESRQAEFSEIADWDARGRLAIDTGERGYQARFQWHQRGDQLELVVRGALGARSFRIAGDASRLTVESRGETQVLTDPERQLSEILEWWLPVTSIEHWLLGQADPDFESGSDLGAAGTLSSLDQRDWEILYTEYQLAQNLLIPRRITLTHPPLELTLAITDWQSVAGEP